MAYLEAFDCGPMDSTLPYHIYHTALDFLMERLVMAFDTEAGSVKGRLIAESRGPRDDAQLQHEFARLHIDGTSYISSSWFR